MNNKFIPIIIYNDADKDKITIFNDNRNKSGVYRWVNKINGNTYIGSSINLSVRFYSYFSLMHLAKSNRPIDRALLLYGFSQFKLEIIEYCDKSIVLEREDYFMNMLNPEYNIVAKAGSTLGYRHSPESIAKMRNFVLSDEVKDRKKLSTKNATEATKIQVLVKDMNYGVIMEFSSMTEAAKALSVSKASISQALLNKRLIQKRYSITKK